MEAAARTGTVFSLRPMLDYARLRGVEVDALLAEVGIARSALEDPDVRVPETKRERAWLLAAERSGDPVFGLSAAERTPRGAFDVLDYAVSASATLDDALARIVRFQRLISDAIEMRLGHDDGDAHLSIDPHRIRPAVDFVFAWIVARARAVTKTSLRVRRISFAREKPADTHAYTSYFGCDVVFGGVANELVIAARDTALAIPSSEPPLLSLLERYGTQQIARLPERDSILSRIHHAVEQTLRGGRPSLRATALAMHASPRTVQRWLTERGLTYRDVVEAVRRQLASPLLDDGHAVTEVAYLLGFGDVSSFRRAHKRWTGAPPSRRARVA